MAMTTQRLAAVLGISAVSLFGIALMAFSRLNPEFHLLQEMSITSIRLLRHADALPAAEGAKRSVR